MIAAATELTARDWADRAVERAAQFELLVPEHRYRRRADGRPMLGTTDVLKSQGFFDPEQYTVEGRERGTFVHDASVLVDADDLDDASVPASYAGYIESYRRFLDSHRPTWFLTETLIADDLLDYCGTLDRFGVLRSSLWVIDLKTGAKAKWHGLQVAAYERALRPAGSPRSAKRGTLYLHDDGKEATLEPCTDRLDYDFFLAALTCSRYRERYA